jgi:hypothetical protein
MAKRSGGVVRIPDPPKLTFYQMCLFEAFSELSTDRQIGMGEGPIPWSSVVAYAEMYGYCPVTLSYIIRRVDEAYLKLRAPKDKDSGNAAGTSKSNAKARKSRR